MRIAHCIPAYRSQVHVEVAMSLARESSWCANGDDGERGRYAEYVPFFIDAPGIARARNLGVEQALAIDADLLLFQDADVFMPATLHNRKRSADCSVLEVFERTINRADTAAVGAAVCIRNGNRMNCEPAQPGQVYEGVVGTGLMLIDIRKLRDVPRPWFVHTDTADGLGVECGEDVYFCRLLQRHGFKVFVDYSIETGHAGGVVDATKL